MPQAWSAKRERQYEHIKEGLEERGTSEKKAEEIAARTVNKERARAGEAQPRVAPASTTSARPAAAGSARIAVRAGRRTSSCTPRPAGATSKAGRR